MKLLPLLAALALPLAGPVPAAAAAATPDPVIGHAVFNDPTGTPARQNAIAIQLAGLIDRVPAGEEIRLTVFGFDTPDTADSPDAPDLVDHFVAAHDRGVRVKIILDQGQAGNGPHTRLKAALGTDDTQPSWVVTCGDQFPSGPKRGCIGTRVKQWSDSTAYADNHNKFALFSKVRLDDGSVRSGVVYVASANIGVWDANESYNNAFTYSDPGTFGAYRAYFEDLRRYRYSKDGNNDYYRDSGSGTDYRAFFFPRHEGAGKPFEDPGTDTIVSTLNSVHCSYTETDGSRHQTDVRIAMWAFTRPAIAQKLAALKQAGCWVDVVYSNASQAVLDALNGIQVTKCDYAAGPGIDVRVHSKYLLVDGGFDDDIVPRVYTGSHNYAWSSLRQEDENLLRIMGRGPHTEYLANFHQVRDTCRAKASAAATG
ncbi:phospholipase D-like domain-containing protein [Amycolatopsis australiensis]|uniref:phospholipase D n=1 Tax=Amycolatopsis australiensis TaxID=546364 RepID=A0A1K1RX13_9PSEU|nr:phospholipase D-like domain-containing protein [Amycolatopsis australiensis]SFW76372.1 Phosphatidylserine/phosphatidylglycerophosphate/cardiolipin synthase [Amycolatopsis australiensis]